MSSSPRAVARVVLALASCAPLAASGGETAIADLSQGTNMTVALAPNAGRLVVGLVDQLWRVPAAGGAAEALTSADETARNPRYSPDGGSIAFQRLGDGQWDIWLLDLSTGERRALTSTPLDEIEPEFTSDGRAVVFVSNRTGHFCLWSVDLASGVETQLTEESGRRVVPVRFRARSDRLPSAPRDAAGASRVAAVRGHGRARVSQRRSRTAELAPRRRRPGVQRARWHDREPAAHARARRPHRRQADHRRRGHFLHAPSVAFVSGVHLRVGRPAWRRAIALQNRQPVHVFAGRVVEARPPPADLPLLDEAARKSRAESPASRQRPTAGGPRSQR